MASCSGCNRNNNQTFTENTSAFRHYNADGVLVVRRSPANRYGNTATFSTGTCANCNGASSAGNSNVIRR
jgi:hypothetical protein